MTPQEFSKEFDIFYNNINSGKAPGVIEYEKSVFLTKAQDQLLKNYFNPAGNKYGQGYSDSPKRTVDFSNVMKSVSISGSIGIDTTYKNTMIYNRPNDLLLPTGFVLRNIAGKELQVVHVDEAEMTRLYSKPYKEPYKGSAYKLDNSSDSFVYEIIVGRAGINDSYKLYLRYVRKPQPIILEDLSDSEKELGLEPNTLTIAGQRSVSPCELDTTIHYEILDRAVNLAKIHYETSPEAMVQYSMTNE